MATSGFELSPMVSVTIQSVVLSATSNLLAQALTAYQTGKPFVVDWVPVVQFIVFTIINTPPNFMWQDFLEQTFPSRQQPGPSAQADKKSAQPAAEPKLNVRNTLIKTVLDQTVGSAVNTVIFAVFMNSLKAAMARPAGFEGPEQSVAFLVSGYAIDYSRVDWRAIFDRAAKDFMPLIKAGWRLWPAVSLVNFAFVKSVQGRNLVGGLAGIGWGIYVSLLAAE